MISVPRPAMLVATVTAPNLPAWATISASFSWFLAFSRLCWMPSRASRPLSSSFFSMDTVPTSTGWPLAWQSLICWMTARYLPASVLYTTSWWSWRWLGRLVGISTMSSS